MYQEALKTQVMGNLIKLIQNKHSSQTLSDINQAAKDFFRN